MSHFTASICCLLPCCCASPRKISIFSAPSHQVVADCNEVPLKPSLLQAPQAPLAQPLLIHYVLQPRPSRWPLLDPFQYVHVCLVLRSPELDPGLKVCLTNAEQRERTISLNLQATSFLMQPRTLLVFLAARAHCWLIVNFSARTFSAKMLSNWSMTIPYWCMGLFLLGPGLCMCLCTTSWHSHQPFSPACWAPLHAALPPLQRQDRSEHNTQHTAEQEGLKWKQGGHTVNVRRGIVESHLSNPRGYSG